MQHFKRHFAIFYLGAALTIFSPAAETQEIFRDGFEDLKACTTACDVQFPLLVDPTGIFTNTPTDVRIQARLLPSGYPPESLKIFRLDEQGNPTGEAQCELLDNGNLGNGDDIANDSVFSCFIPMLESATGQVGFKLVEIRGDVFAYGPAFFIEVVDDLTQEEAQTILDTQAAAKSIWLAKLAQFGDTLQARQETAIAISALPGVAEAGVSVDGFTIWIHYDSGVRGGLMLNPDGTRGGGVAGLAASRISTTTPVARSDARQPAEFLQVSGLANGAEPPVVGNNNVLIWDAYNFQFAPFDEGPGLKTLFEGAQCPNYSVTYIKDTQATVDSVRTFGQYDTIILVTHGAVDGDGQVVFLTDETTNLISIISHAIDLVLGRVSIMGDVFAIRPGFISSLPGSFENSIIYNGSCQSSANGTMSAAFIGKGAGTYYGNTKVVNSNHAQNVATQLFDGLVTDHKSTGEAFAAVSPKTDPTAPNAVFTQTGQTEVAYSGDFRDGGFEKGNLGAWGGDGDARVVSRLGPFSPTEGAFEGLISTGLGFSIDSGSIEQNFCLPATATTLNFDWNFSSEEFIEYCGPDFPFDDTFEVVLETDSGSQTLFSREIDTLCLSGVAPSSLSFDQSPPGCIPTDGVGYGTGGNDCTVYSTGWNIVEAIDISAIATANNGKGVTLRFRSFDTGDSIYDSAVILDDIQIEVP